MSRVEKKTEILLAAGRIFFKNGFEGTKIEDIAKEAGIGKGTVYEYFASKQQLFEEMIIFSQNTFVSEMQKVLAGGECIKEKFKLFARFMTEMIKEHIQIFDLMSNSKIIIREMGAIMHEFNLRMEEVLVGVVEEAKNRGELRSELKPELLTSVMMGTVVQYCSKMVVVYKIEPEKMDYNEVVDAVMQGIGKNPA